MSDPLSPAPARPPKSAAAFRTIGEAADELDVPAHVLRFWETKFPQLKPVKRSGGRRYYRPEDIDLLRRIRRWLYQDGYTIRGVQQLLETRPAAIAAAGEAADPNLAGGFAIGSDCEVEAAPEAAFDAAPEAAPPRRDQAGTPAPPAADRPPAALDPETRAELEEIRRELRQARALLDEVLWRARSS